MSAGENMAYVYMLRCDDDTLYTGITNDIEKRIKNHLGKNCASHAKYMRGRKPLELVALWQTQDYKVAAKLEYAIKKRLSRTQKFALAENPSAVAEVFPHLAEFEFAPMETPNSIFEQVIATQKKH